MWLGALLVAGLCLPASACRSKTDAAAQVAATAEPFTVHECAACGMVVREQPAPRGQVVHRDGQREYLCSLGDMLQYLRTPSSHGAAEQVFVELLDPATDPERTSTAPRPWAPAGGVHFVVGVARPGIMGKPVLTYATADEATAVATKHGGQVKTWTELQALPLSGH